MNSTWEKYVFTGDKTDLPCRIDGSVITFNNGDLVFVDGGEGPAPFIKFKNFGGKNLTIISSSETSEKSVMIPLITNKDFRKLFTPYKIWLRDKRLNKLLN